MLKPVFEKLFRMREQASRMRPGADKGFDAHEKPFLDHLEDLRHTLMRIGATLFVSTLLCFTFHKQIFNLIQLPVKSRFAQLGDGVSLWERTDLITLNPPEFILLMLKLSFFSAVIISFPITIYFLFQFILPGLRQVEKKAVIPGSLVGFALFLFGVCFAFFLAAPIALKFFYVFENERISSIDPVAQAMKRPIADFRLVGVDGASIPPVGKERAPEDERPDDPEAAAPPPLPDEIREEIRNYLRGALATMEISNFTLRYDDTRDKIVIIETKGGRSVYRIGEYISFITRLVLVFGISFQLPVIVTILVRLELLTARVMRSTRLYAWIIILVASAILTPPDLITLVMLAGPMIILYEICILIASFIERRRERREMEEEEARRQRLAKLYEKPASDLSEEEKAEIHRAEIEQYEREHAHLYEEENQHDEEDPLHGGTEAGHGLEDPYHDDPYHSDPHHHDPHDDPYHDDPHHGIHDESWEEDRPRDAKGSAGADAPGALESDHAEPEDLRPEGGGPEAGAVPDDFFDEESCRPEGPVIDINHATAEELATLPGIGPKLAEAIVEHRPFETFDQLERVPGLGTEKINRMIDRLMLG